jgi:hypothetical protein
LAERWLAQPKRFGIHPSVELEFEFAFFQAARLIFEHMFMLHRVNDHSLLSGFDIPRISKLIEDCAANVAFSQS